MGGGQTGSLVQPVLVDAFEREYASVGYGIEGKRDGAIWREFAYSAEAAGAAQGRADKAGQEYPGKVLLLSRGGSVEYVTFYYLVATREHPGAIIGVLARQGPGRTKPGEIWSPSGEVDYLSVPARQ